MQRLLPFWQQVSFHHLCYQQYANPHDKLAGVILANDPAPIDSRQFNNKNFVVAGFSPLGSSTSPTEVVTEPTLSVQYVPNSLEGKIRITNVEYLEEYNDHQSPIYMTLTREIENGLKESLTDKSLNVKVLNLT